MNMSPESSSESGTIEDSMIRLRGRWLNKNEEGIAKRDAALSALRSTHNSKECKYQDLRGISLRTEDLSGIDFSHCDLSGADLTEANLSNTKFVYAVLVATQLTGANIDSLHSVGADFSRANLDECYGDHISFGACIMTNATFFGAKIPRCTLSKSTLINVDMRTCDLTESRFCGADLERTNLAGANLQRVDFTGSKVNEAVFNDADLREATLRGILDYNEASWVNADIRQVDFCGAYLLRRHIMDENYLYEFKNHSRSHAKLFWVWRLTSDCGRSLLRWGLSILMVVLFFAATFSQLDIDYGNHETVLSPLYFSVVTITTLGYGDVLPKSVPAQIACIIEVILGYMALGGMLSIFANKMARRAE